MVEAVCQWVACGRLRRERADGARRRRIAEWAACNLRSRAAGPGEEMHIYAVEKLCYQREAVHGQQRARAQSF